MKVGFVMLCHEALDRAAEVARYWADRGCPVVIHVDAKVGAEAYKAFADALADRANILFSRRWRCAWGRWSLVGATQDATTMILDRFPEIDHVFLASGTCLPLRPASELMDYLSAHPGTDFIESVTTQDVPWTKGGLDHERFTLLFPFAWKGQRRLFDRATAFQRRIGYRRHIPDGIEPHMGSQWWCLTRKTLTSILKHPRRAEFDRYFRRVWIPDESYFQSLVRLVSNRVESRSLTLAKFDFQGKPHVFYDDHLQLLRRSDCFVARKIWPRADALYSAFLSDDRMAQSTAEPNPGKIDRIFSKAVERRTRGRPGLYMVGRMPRIQSETGRTCARYVVFEGFGDLFQDFPSWAARATGLRVHGHLFGPDRAEFAEGQRFAAGALSDHAKLRDYHPTAFLTNLLWNTRGERQAFLYGPRDTTDVGDFMAYDGNAEILVITGAWTLPLFRAGEPIAAIRKTAAELQRIENAHLTQLRNPYTKAHVRIWSLADFVAAPVEPLQMLVEDLGRGPAGVLTEAPRMVDLDGFPAFLQALRNEGMQPYLVGDFQGPDDGDQPARIERRPYIVN